MQMQVEEIFPGVYEMRSVYGRDSSGLFGGQPIPHALWYIAGPTPALIDPGPTVVARQALEEIRKLGHDPEALEYAIPSHIHIDHAGAGGWLARTLPRVKVVIHSKGAPFLLDPTRLRQGTASVFGPNWEDLFGPLDPVPEDRLLAVEDGAEFILGGRRHRILHLPGHSLDHIGVYDEDLDALYCGHALGQYNPGRFFPDPPATLPWFDVSASLASIARIRDLNPRYVLPVHSGFLPMRPAWAVDLVERVTRELRDLIQQGAEEGLDLDALDERVRAHLFGLPHKAGRSYRTTVQAYLGYFERQRRKA